MCEYALFFIIWGAAACFDISNVTICIKARVNEYPLFGSDFSDVLQVCYWIWYDCNFYRHNTRYIFFFSTCKVIRKSLGKRCWQNESEKRLFIVFVDIFMWFQYISGIFDCNIECMIFFFDNNKEKMARQPTTTTKKNAFVQLSYVVFTCLRFLLTLFFSLSRIQLHLFRSKYKANSDQFIEFLFQC